MEIYHKFMIAILLGFTYKGTDGKPDYCSDDSNTYSYRVVRSTNKKWFQASNQCRGQYKGCLARPRNASELQKIKNEISHTSTHGTYYYWVGLKSDNQPKLKWDNDKDVVVDNGIREIVNMSRLAQTEVCFTVAEGNMLSKEADCNTGQKFVCQIPNTKTPGPMTTIKPKASSVKPSRMSFTRTRQTNSRPTQRPKFSLNQKVDEYVENAKKIKVQNKDSIKTMMAMTSSFMINLKKDTNITRGRIMKAALTIENFGMEYAKLHFNNSYNASVLEKSEGYVFEMRKISSKKNISFPPRIEQRKSMITLPGTLLDKGHIVVNALFTEFTDYIPITRDKENKQNEIISPVISSTLEPKPGQVLKENVTIVLEHFKKPSKFKPVCVFWDVNVENELGGEWSSVGCKLVQSNDKTTLCSCNHLTSFALLMQIDHTPSVSSEHMKSLSYITYIGCACSLIGEAFTVLAYVLLMNMKQEQCQIRVNLAISLAVAQIFFLSGITATSNLGVCTFVGVMLHYFYLVAFGWMMLEGVYLYLMVVKVFNTVIKMKLYYIFAWGFPLLIISISLIIASTFEGGVDSYTNKNFCWVSFSNGLIWTFAGPVLIISMINIYILVCAVREIIKLNRAKFDQAETFRQGIKACVVLFPLLGLTWLFGLLSVTNAGIVFQYIFTILNSFQGLLIFILHVLRSGEIRSSFKHKIQRWETTRSTNFMSSKSAIDISVSSSTDHKHPMKYQYSMNESKQELSFSKNKVNPMNSEISG